jgi:hypothetical protein
MLAHAFYAFVLLVFAHDSHRTIKRFGGRRSGFASALLVSPTAHILFGGTLSCLFASFLALKVTPAYFAALGLIISLRYFVASVRYNIARNRARFGKQD